MSQRGVHDFVDQGHSPIYLARDITSFFSFYLLIKIERVNFINKTIFVLDILRIHEP